MTTLPVYQIDAFTDRPFSGNPAAVVPLAAWLEDSLLQSLAAEMNLSETAFFVPEGKGYRLRWFTPLCEVELCGHATLAAASVIFDSLGPQGEVLRFATLSGPLEVQRRDGLLILDFPARRVSPCPEEMSEVAEALGVAPTELYAWRHTWVAVLPDAAAVRAVAPDMGRLVRATRERLIVTAPGGEEGVDFVSRFFAPAVGVAEDPVTGSAHCSLTPFWAARLGRDRLTARQVSRRCGELIVENRGDRVAIGGKAVRVMEGTIRL